MKSATIVQSDRRFDEICEALVETLKTRFETVEVVASLTTDDPLITYIMIEFWGVVPKRYIAYDVGQGLTDRQQRDSERVWSLFRAEGTVYVPFRYSECLDYYRVDDLQDIDVLFYGTLSERRVNTLGRIRKMGMTVKVLHETYGLERDSVVCRAKIVLNLHRETPARLEVGRLVPLLSNGVFVVSETDLDWQTNQEWKDYVVFGDLDVIPEICRTWVARPVSRSMFAKRAYEKFKTVSMSSQFPWSQAFPVA